MTRLLLPAVKTILPELEAGGNQRDGIRRSGIRGQDGEVIAVLCIENPELASRINGQAPQGRPPEC